MAEALTERQKEILNFISASITERGYPPTLREIGEHFGIRSTNGVNDHLKALEKKGHLRREDLKSRAMRPVALDGVNGRGEVIPLRAAAGSGVYSIGGNVGEPLEDDNLCEVPILGRVAAGQPLLAVEHATDTVRIDRMLLGESRGQRDVFGLRIVGESMIEDGILDGDYVFVKKAANASPGDVVVAMIDGDATVKRYYPEGDHIRFQPANSNMEPIIVRRADFRNVDIIGIVVGVYRRL